MWLFIATSILGSVLVLQCKLYQVCLLPRARGWDEEPWRAMTVEGPGIFKEYKSLGTGVHFVTKPESLYALLCSF